MSSPATHVVEQEKSTYNPSEVAKATGRHPGTIRRLLREGEIEGHKVGGEWIIFPDALRDWLGEEVYQHFFGPDD